MQQLALAYQKDPYRTRHVCHPVISSCLCNVDMGYQNQMLNSRNLPGNANLINHIFLLQFFINL